MCFVWDCDEVVWLDVECIVERLCDFHMRLGFSSVFSFFFGIVIVLGVFGVFKCCAIQRE